MVYVCRKIFERKNSAEIKKRAERSHCVACSRYGLCALAFFSFVTYNNFQMSSKKADTLEIQFEAFAKKVKRKEDDDMADKFLLIDGSSLLFRAFYALPPLAAKDGTPTGAVYGLCNMLAKLIGEVQPRYMAVAFDKARQTFRTRLYAAYKGQRKETPEELKSQFPLAIKVLEALNIEAPELDDYEADDIIGTLARTAPQGAEVIIVTGDRDELQLLDSRTKVYYTRKGISDLEIFDEEKFAEVYEGLRPAQLIDLKGLMGDTSDNIPGVPGIGPKTALKLLQERGGSVESVLASLEEVKAKGLREKLRSGRESALLSKQLATINREAPVAAESSLYVLKGMKPEAQALFAELEFRTLYQRFAKLLGMEEEEQSLFAPEEAEPETVTEINAANAQKLFAAFAAASRPVALACTVTGELPDLFIEKAEFCFDGKIYRLLSDKSTEKIFDAYLADPQALKAVCGSKELYKVCLCGGKILRGVTEDVSLAAYLDQPGAGGYDSASLARRYLAAVPASAAAQVAALLPVLSEKLQEQELTAVYREAELPLAPVLARMEAAGIEPDLQGLEEQSRAMSEKIARLEQQAYEEAGENFNLKSPKQLGIVLFEHLKLPVQKKTKSGYSTDVKVLEALRGEHPLVETVLEHRKYSKLQSTYLDGLRPLINPRTGRIHTHFQQTVTVTGRLSSTDPNLQNIPTRTEEGRAIRRLFVPGDGYDYLLSCDYSQVELRILASIAQDKLLLDSFRKGQDVHARTAAEVFGLPLEQVTHEQRGRAKAVNFGIVYGISDFGLAAQLGVGRAEAAGYIKNYLQRYSGVKEYMEKIVAQARAKGYVATLLGRRRYLRDINSSNFNLRTAAERTAINTPIQGTAADIMKLAMIKVDRALTEAKLKSRILLQVHDELVLEVTEAEREETAKLVQKAMEEAFDLGLPLPAEVSWGTNWADAK